MFYAKQTKSSSKIIYDKSIYRWRDPKPFKGSQTFREGHSHSDNSSTLISLKKTLLPCRKKKFLLSVKHKDDDTDKNICFLSDISDGKYETMGSRSNKVSSLYLHLTSKKNSNILAWHLHTESERKPFF